MHRLSNFKLTNINTQQKHVRIMFMRQHKNTHYKRDYYPLIAPYLHNFKYNIRKLYRIRENSLVRTGRSMLGNRVARESACRWNVPRREIKWPPPRRSRRQTRANEQEKSARKFGETDARRFRLVPGVDSGLHARLTTRRTLQCFYIQLNNRTGHLLRRRTRAHARTATCARTVLSLRVAPSTRTRAESMNFARIQVTARTIFSRSFVSLTSFCFYFLSARNSSVAAVNM